MTQEDEAELKVLRKILTREILIENYAGERSRLILRKYEEMTEKYDDRIKHYDEKLEELAGKEALAQILGARKLLHQLSYAVTLYTGKQSPREAAQLLLGEISNSPFLDKEDTDEVSDENSS